MNMNSVFEEELRLLGWNSCKRSRMPSLLLWHYVKQQLYYKSKGITLWDQMINIFDKYGYFKEGQKAVTMKGAEGAVQIAKMMDDLRNKST